MLYCILVMYCRVLYIVHCTALYCSHSEDLSPPVPRLSSDRRHSYFSSRFSIVSVYLNKTQGDAGRICIQSCLQSCIFFQMRHISMIALICLGMMSMALAGDAETGSDDPWWSQAAAEMDQLKVEDHQMRPIVYPSLAPVVVNHEAATPSIYGPLFWCLMGLVLSGAICFGAYCLCLKGK